MKATIKEAHENRRRLTIRKTGYGHFKISCLWYGREYSTTTTDTVSVDNFRSEDDEKWEGRNRVLYGYECLCGQIKNANFRY